MFLKNSPRVMLCLCTLLTRESKLYLIPLFFISCSILIVGSELIESKQLGSAYKVYVVVTTLSTFCEKYRAKLEILVGLSE